VKLKSLHGSKYGGRQSGHYYDQDTLQFMPDP